MDDAAKPAKDYNGRDPFTIPVPEILQGKLQSVRRGGREQIRVARAPDTNAALEYVKEKYLYAFHETGRTEDLRTVQLSHDIHPDITLSISLTRSDMLDLKLLRPKIITCNSQLATRPRTLPNHTEVPKTQSEPHADAAATMNGSELKADVAPDERLTSGEKPVSAQPTIRSIPIPAGRPRFMYESDGQVKGLKEQLIDLGFECDETNRTRARFTLKDDPSIHFELYIRDGSVDNDKTAKILTRINRNLKLLDERRNITAQDSPTMTMEAGFEEILKDHFAHVNFDWVKETLESMGLREIKVTGHSHIFALPDNLDLTLTVPVDDDRDVPYPVLKNNTRNFRTAYNASLAAKSEPEPPREDEQHFSVRMGQKREGMTVDVKGNSVRLTHSRVPYIAETYTHDAAIDQLPDETRRAALSEEFHQHIENLAEGLIGVGVMEEVWREHFGGSVVPIEGGIAFCHGLLKTKYEITADHPATPDRLAAIMTEMSKEIFKRNGHRTARIDRLEFRDYQIGKTPGLITVTHSDPAFQPVQFALEGSEQVLTHDPKEELKRLESLYIRKTDIEKLRQAAEKQKRKDEQRLAKAPPPPAPIPQAIYIIDSGPIIDLFKPRPGKSNRAWIDLLDVLANLPTTKYIIFPSVVADWELRGAVPSRLDIADHSTRMEQVDQRSLIIEKWNLAQLDPYFRSAHRLALMRDGTQEWIKGSPKENGAENKFVVWESQQQHDFYGELLGMIKRRGDEGVRYRDAVGEARRIRGRDEGEKACIRIAQSIENNHPVYIISNDRQFRNSIYDAVKNNALHTHGGRGITALTTLQLVRHLAQGCGGDLSTHLAKISEEPEEPVNFNSFFLSMSKHIEGLQDPRVSAYDYAQSKLPDGNFEISIQTLINRGFKEQALAAAALAESSKPPHSSTVRKRSKWHRINGHDSNGRG